MNRIIKTKKYLVGTLIFGLLDLGLYFIPLSIPIPNALIKRFMEQCPSDTSISCDPATSVGLAGLLFIPFFVLFVISGLTYLITSLINYVRRDK